MQVHLHEYHILEKKDRNKIKNFTINKLTFNFLFLSQIFRRNFLHLLKCFVESKFLM